MEGGGEEGSGIERRGGGEGERKEGQYIGWMKGKERGMRR